MKVHGHTIKNYQDICFQRLVVYVLALIQNGEFQPRTRLLNGSEVTDEDIPSIECNRLRNNIKQ